MEENRNVNNVPAEGNEDSINFSIHDLIQMVIGNWFWFLLSTVVCLSCALFYIYTAPKVYNRTATILIKDGKKGSWEPRHAATSTTRSSCSNRAT